jgi:hypothetical protein
MINVVEALPIRAQVSLLLMLLLFVARFIFDIIRLRDFPVNLVVLVQNVIMFVLFL